jgi:hypothetical protein
MSFLIHPLEQIPCKTIKGVEALECAKSNTKENLEIMLLSEERLTKKHPDESADLNELKEFCPAWRIRSSEIEKIVEIDSHEEIQKFAAKLPAEPNKDTGYKSSPKYEVLFTALHNHAYYIMTGSLRRWVIEREKEFENEMNSKYPDYTKSKEVKDVEREGAVMEQILHSSRHRKSFYYKYKYLFRAMDHIGFEVDKKIPELSVIHTLLKKTRPDTIDDAYSEIRKLLNSGITKEKEYSVLKKYEEKLTPSLFAEMVKKYDKLQYDALREYFAKRANEKNSVWAPVCKI